MDSNDIDRNKLHEVNLALAAEPLPSESGGGEVPCNLPLWLVESFYEEGWLAHHKPELGTIEFTEAGAALERRSFWKHFGIERERWRSPRSVRQESAGILGLAPRTGAPSPGRAEAEVVLQGIAVCLAASFRQLSTG